MKILLATECYIHHTGGITASVLALATGLRHYGHEVKVLALSNTDSSFRDGDDYFIRSFPSFYYPGLRMSFAGNDPLLRELAEWGPDLIHAQTEGSTYRFALKIRKQCRVPMVMTCHTNYGYYIFGNFQTNPIAQALLAMAGRILYRPAVQVIAPSKKAARFAFLRSTQDRLTVVPNGMELAKYRRQFTEEERLAFRRSLGIEDGERVFVTVTRLSKEKNIEELVTYFPDLLKKDPNSKLLIVGDGPDMSHLEQLKKELGLEDRVLFPGRIPPQEVWKYYSAGDVFVSASTFEVHSMSFLEALANGLPMLCRKDDALDGVLEPGDNGFLYQSKEEFLDFAHRLLQEDRLRETMAERSLKRSDGFAADPFAAAVLKVYEKALKGSGT